MISNGVENLEGKTQKNKDKKMKRTVKYVTKRGEVQKEEEIL